MGLAGSLFSTTDIFPGGRGSRGRKKESAPGIALFCVPLSIREVVGISPAGLVLCQHRPSRSRTYKTGTKTWFRKSSTSAGGSHREQRAEGSLGLTQAKRNRAELKGAEPKGAERNKGAAQPKGATPVLGLQRGIKSSIRCGEYFCY